MSIGLASPTALLVDDEPEYLGWLMEFVESLRLKVELAENLPKALEAINTKEFRLIVLDMNIPLGGARALADSPLKERFPGIVAAVKARTKGYGRHQVIAYTVHDDDAADAELAVLGCRYVLKGRPGVLKSVIRSSLDQSARQLRKEPGARTGRAKRAQASKRR